MPSQEHALLVDLFRASPRLALDLLRALGVGGDAVLSASPRLLESTFPVTSPDYHVDLALAFDDARGAVALVALVEVQLEVDPGKLRSWPLYQAAARARFKCDACVLVVAIEERVAAWAAAPVPLGPGGSVFRAVVLGPSAVPRGASGLTAPSPELALLSALCHGQREPDLVGVAVASIAELGDERARAYFDLLRYHLGEALDRALEAVMATSQHKYLSDFAQKYYGEGVAEGEAKGMAEGEARGKAEGEAKGKADGEAKGKAEGKAEGARAALLTVIAARGVALTPEDRARIAACVDVDVLDAWVARAAQAVVAGDVFGG